MDDPPCDISEAEIAPGIAVREPFVVDAQQVQNGGMEIVDVNAVMHGSETKVIGLSVRDAPFDTAPGKPRGEAEVIVVSAGTILRSWCATKFPAPDHEGLFE